MELWLPAFLAGLMILVTHVPLGIRVLDRGIVFIDLAIAQVASLGVVASSVLGLEPLGWGVQISAFGAALAGAILLSWSEKHWPDVQEATIGSLFVLSASTSVLLLAGDPHGGDHLQELLAGQILWVTPDQLVSTFVLSAPMAAWLFWRGDALKGLPFYALFACAITLSVQLVGVYLVFASLILPALASRQLTGKKRLAVASLYGASCYLAGLILADQLDLPPGPMIVWVLASAGLMLFFLTGQKRRFIE